MKISSLSIFLIFFIICCLVFLFFHYWPSSKISNEKGASSEIYVSPDRIAKHTVDGYTVFEIKNLLSHEECDHLIEVANKKGYMDSEVYNDNAIKNNKLGDLDTEFRLSKTCWIENHEEPLADKISDYSVFLTHIPKENNEALQVARYNINGKFDSHYDCCVYDDEEKCRIMNGNAGQRRSTLMVYLNDDFEGGETEFVNIGITIKPEKGKAILFWSTYENGMPIENSMHRGKKVTKGMKIICTKWSHMNKWENMSPTLAHHK